MPKDPKTVPANGDSRPEWLTKITTAVEFVTPEIADKWLKQGPNFNRGIGPQVVFRYSSAMREERWFFTGESVIFDSGEPGADVLLDGWHRLSAIVESGKGQWMVVVRGVPRGAFHYIDHGKGRVFRDTLHVLSVPNASFLASATSYLTGFLKDGRFTTNGLQDHERWGTYETHGGRLAELQEQYNKRLPLKGVPAPLLTAAHFVLRQKDADEADSFMEELVLGDDLEADHPLTQLRQIIRKFAVMDKKPSNLPTKLGAGIVKAWNLVRKNEKVSKFTLPSTTPQPV
jgi:hypothetical protein